MPISETQAWAEAAASVPKDDVMLTTLEFLHPAFVDEDNLPTAIRAVRNTEDLDLRLEVGASLNSGELVTWKAFPFEIDFPAIGDLGIECSLKLDNVGREVSRFLAAAVVMNTPVIVMIRGYLSSDPETVGQGPYRLELRNVTRRASSLEGKLRVASTGELRFLRQVYDMVRFPSLMTTS